MVFIWWPFYECKCDHDVEDEIDDLDLGWLSISDWLFYGGVIFFLSWFAGWFAWGMGWWNPIELIQKFI